MGAVHDSISPQLASWIAAQPVVFVGTAPRADDGRINISPKGLDLLRVLDERTVGYVDLIGSGIETYAHLRENGRITLMWCAFTGPPKVLRIHGRGEPVFRDDPRWPELIGHFAAADGPGARAIVLVHATMVSDSCGFAVPFMDYREERSQHAEYFGRKSEAEFAAYCARKPHNEASIDGLPALPLPLPGRTA